MTECGGHFSNASGLLTSPLHPNHPPPGIACAYLISLPRESYVNLTIITLDIDCQEMHATSDYLELRDGMYEESPILGTICGYNDDFVTNLQTTQNHLTVR